MMQKIIKSARARLRLLWYIVSFDRYDIVCLMIEAAHLARVAKVDRVFDDDARVVLTEFRNGIVHPLEYDDVWDALTAVLEQRTGSDFHPAELGHLVYEVDARNHKIHIPGYFDSYHEITLAK